MLLVGGGSFGPHSTSILHLSHTTAASQMRMSCHVSCFNMAYHHANAFHMTMSWSIMRRSYNMTAACCAAWMAMGGCKIWHTKMAATPAIASTCHSRPRCIRRYSCTPTDVSDGTACLRHTCASCTGRRRIESATGVQWAEIRHLHTQNK